MMSDTGVHDHTQPGDRAASSPETAEAPSAPRALDPNLVPAWVALLVLAAIVVLAGVAGFAINGYLHRANDVQYRELAAIELWRAKVVDSPQDVESRISLANAFQDAGQLRSALAEYDTVLRDHPKDVAALYSRGTILLALGQPRDAESAFWAVLAEDPGHVRSAEALGEYYAAKQQYRSLVKAVRPAVALHPTEARLQYLMGVAYENLGHKDWAVTRYRLALDAVPDMPEALQALARLGLSH
jgi:tetratricopeptide (TPR) repeat protein